MPTTTLAVIATTATNTTSLNWEEAMKIIDAIAMLLIMTGSALADCKSEFFTLNRVTLEAGPYTQRDRTQTFEGVNRNELPTSTISTTSDFVPP